MFVANGYERNEVKRCLREKVKEKTEETREYRGVVNIPYVKGLSEQFKRVAEKHGVRATFRPGRKLKELRKRSQYPLGGKRNAVVYRIPCGCDKAVYVGETYRQFETRKKEHESKVRLTRQDIEKGRLDSAERMEKEDGGLASHSIKCESEIDWGKSKIVAMETGYRQRKAREGIESLRELHGGKEILNNYEQLTVWQTVLNSYFKREVTEKRGTLRAHGNNA